VVEKTARGTRTRRHLLRDKGVDAGGCAGNEEAVGAVHHPNVCRQRSGARGVADRALLERGGQADGEGGGAAAQGREGISPGTGRSLLLINEHVVGNNKDGEGARACRSLEEL
jgi:hypothetical protein